MRNNIRLIYHRFSIDTFPYKSRRELDTETTTEYLSASLICPQR